MSNYKEWRLDDFSGGLNENGIVDNSIAENQASKCQNIYCPKIGMLTNLKGQLKINTLPLTGTVQGLHPFYLNSTRKLIVAAGGQVGYLQDGVFTALKTGLDINAICQFETLVNTMVCFNGVDAPWKYDGTTVSALANAPTDGQFAILYKEKLFTVKLSDPSTLVWSDSFLPETWSAVNYWDVRKGDGDVITNLTPYLGDLMVFKRYSSHVLRGTSLDDFNMDEIDPNIGAVGQKAVVFDGMYLYIIFDDGIYMFNGARFTNISRLNIDWGKINLDYIHNAVAGRWNGLLWFALPEGTSTTNNLVLLFNPVTQAWWVRRNIDVSCFITFDDGTDLKFYSGGSSDNYVRQQWIGSDDDGIPIDAFWEGKAFDMGYPEHPKKCKKAFVTDTPGANDAVLTLAFDYGNMETLVASGGDEIVRRFNSPSKKWRVVTPRIEHNAVGTFEVKGIMLYYKIKSKPKVW